MNIINQYAQWFKLENLNEQERKIAQYTMEFFGIGKNGFCDYSLEGIELLIQSIYLMNDWELDDRKDFKDFNSALRFLAYLHFHRIGLTFSSIYDLFVKGYYAEAAILLRTIVEPFIRLKYVGKNGCLQDVNKILLHFAKPPKERFNVHISDMVKSVSPEMYKIYSILCDFSHGGVMAHTFKMKGDKNNYDGAILGLEFNKNGAGLIVNQFSIYLLCHLEYLTQVFPKFNALMPEGYGIKYHKVLGKLWELLRQYSEDKESQFLYIAAKSLKDY